MSDIDPSRPSTKLHKYVVYAPDNIGADTLARRYSVRALHLEAIAPHIKAGIVKVGGMLVDPGPESPQLTEAEGGQNKAIGSLLIIEAKSLEEVRKMIESDIYYTARVWDREKLFIAPFISATPFP